MKKKLLIFLLFFILMIGTAQAITIQTLNDSYMTVPRTGNVQITITSDDGAAITHWFLNGVDLGTNVLTNTLTLSTEQYNNLTIYQTNGGLTSNILNFRIIVTPLFVSTVSTKLDTSLSTNISEAIGESNFTKVMTVPKDYYLNALGLFFYVFVWGIFAGMLYIRQNSWHIPAALAVILSTIVLSQLPASYKWIVQFGIIAGAFAVIYTLFKSKR